MFRTLLMTTAFLTLAALPALSAELHVGAATVSITPDRPVALSGQMRVRIAKTADNPIVATALALESRDKDKVLDQAILVACDLVAIRDGVADKVRRLLKEQLPDFDARKLVLSATHTHAAPEMLEGVFDLPRDGIMQPAEYVEFLAKRVAEAGVTAWKARKPGQVGWGLGHAVVGQNRRSVYADGKAQMYGPTTRPDFRQIEGPEDRGVEVLFFWDAERKLIATAVNVACPSQEVENGSAINADFWHEVRKQLAARHGKDLHILGWTGAAGDQSPHLMYRKAAEERMRKLRGLTRLEEIARRILRACDDAYEGARQEMFDDVPLVHKVQTIALPVREVTKEEYASAKQQVKATSEDPAQRRRTVWHQRVVDRFEQQQAGKAAPYEMELHVLRLGDVAIATNDFELFTDYGIQIKARSKALQTFVIQLAGPGTYLPTARAQAGGGYSAIAESSHVGHQGGQVLVEETVKGINALWPAK